MLFSLIRPALHALPPEGAHTLTLAALRAGLHPLAPPADDPRLRVRLWGRDFPNPIGLAAGFDKNADVPLALHAYGFGFVECGSVTPLAQAGNPRPRIFRLPAQRAVINRLGFNNHGLDIFVRNLQRARRKNDRALLGVNLGKNKMQSDAVADYAAGIRATAHLADYLVINISSPNTPGLRGLQNKEELAALLTAARAALAEQKAPPPLLIKIAPDLDEAALADIAGVAIAQNIQGIIATNTTIDRPEGLPAAIAPEAGGLSGPPLLARSTDVLRRLSGLLSGNIPLIGVGGVSSGADAYAKIRAGASLVQLYTALIYQGPGLVRRIKKELLACLARDGFPDIASAVGTQRP